MDSLSSTINVYHIAGVDDRERGFNRQAQVIAHGETYQARLRYEALQIDVECVEREEVALERLIQALQERGYTQLRTQRIFQGELYLGNQEIWVDYSDPEPDKVKPIAWLMRIQKILGMGKK